MYGEAHHLNTKYSTLTVKHSEANAMACQWNLININDVTTDRSSRMK